MSITAERAELQTITEQIEFAERALTKNIPASDKAALNDVLARLRKERSAALERIAQMGG